MLVVDAIIAILASMLSYCSCPCRFPFRCTTTRVIEKILRHCGLWEESSDRGPPVADLVVEG